MKTRKSFILITVFLLLCLFFGVGDAEGITNNAERTLDWSWAHENNLIAYSNGDMNMFHSSISKLSTDDDAARGTFKLSLLANGVQRLDMANSGVFDAKWDGGETISTSFERQSTLVWPVEMDFALIRENNIDLPKIGSPILTSRFTIILPKSSGSSDLINYVGPDFEKLGIDLEEMDLNSFLDLSSMKIDYNLGINFDEISWYGLQNPNGFTEPIYREAVTKNLRDSKGGVTCSWGEMRETEIGLAPKIRLGS
jgi:hypothetical protein